MMEVTVNSTWNKYKSFAQPLVFNFMHKDGTCSCACMHVCVRACTYLCMYYRTYRSTCVRWQRTR